MANGKPGDNPLTDVVIHGIHRFPSDVEAMLFQIQELGRAQGLWPLGENWPYSPKEFDWEREDDLDGARQLLAELLSALEAGRAGRVLFHPLTRRPLAEGSDD